MKFIIGISRYLLPFLTVVILTKCMLSLLLGHPKEKTYGYIIDMIDGESYPLNMWETSIGRSNSCDIVVGYDTVSRFQAVISRRIDGWYVYDLLSKSGIKINGEEAEKKATIKSGDVLTFGAVQYRFMVADDPVVRVGKKKGKNKGNPPAFAKPQSRDNYTNPPYNNSQNPYANTQTPYGNPQSAYTNAQQPYADKPPYTNSQNPYANTNSPYTNTQNPYGTSQPPYGNSQQYYSGNNYGAYANEQYSNGRAYQNSADDRQGEKPNFYGDENKPNLHFEKPFYQNYGVPKQETGYEGENAGDSIYSDRPTFTVETPGRDTQEESYTYTGSKPAIINRDTGETFILCGNIVSIGRSRSNDIKLQSPAVSRHHADLVLYEDGWAIVDASSSAGTFLNGSRISEPQLLFEGDVIGLSDERLYYTQNPSKNR